ncbi:MAG: NPCBM/NEW2 domain-containing protein [Opitutales bacterium]|nr:NPCBM/NEW2 domain-containing protein [Opitutales bacterium]
MHKSLMFLFASALSAVSAHTASGSDFKDWAQTPPLGWNSWDSFGTTINEAQAKEQADAMAQYLKPYGWEYFTVDIQWYEPNARGHDYKAGAPLEMDAYSRLIPATSKFPSAAEGHGFKPLADYVHSKGLKFGIHLMRGIAKQAVKENTPIWGTSAHAADVANIQSTCQWNPDMYGVDMGKEGAQTYYDSLFQMYADWGVDLVKVDDIARPYDEVQKAEIEAIRKAIDKTGRPIVLSLSPGDTPIEKGSHVMTQANMWRISDDFWDRWPPLYGMFERLNKWTQYRTAGTWPDADMLPFGKVEFGRPTNFTKDEQLTCMSLWCIARSPLILGADMTQMDTFTLDLLTNPEVLEVNQHSDNNRQLSNADNLIVWVADVPGSKDKYVGLFNAQDNSDPFDLTSPDFQAVLTHEAPGSQVININLSIDGAKTLVLAVDEGGDGSGYDHAAWIEPKLIGPGKTFQLSNLPWALATSGWGVPQKDKTIDGKPLQLNGREVKGIGTHAKSVIEFDLPEGYNTFTAKGVVTDGSVQPGRLTFMVLIDPEKVTLPDKANVAVSFEDLGITGKASVRDLWARKDLGTFESSFGQELPLHGAGLYRISPEE